MGTPYLSSVYRMQSQQHGQQQYWTPPGPTTFQMAQNSMSAQMLLDQYIQMGIIQYTGQQHQNQHQNQHQKQHQKQQQYNPADMRTRQSNADAGARRRDGL